MEVSIRFKKLHPQARVPEFKTSGASGADLFSPHNVSLPAQQVCLVPLGFSVAIPEGFELQIRPRSSLALKHVVSILNSPGTVDSDFRGEVQILLVNFGDKDFQISAGDRIAQGVLGRVFKAEFIEVSELDETSRGAGGFGSTGRN